MNERTDSQRLSEAAFLIETVAHLKGLEREMLPTADWLRDYAAEVMAKEQK